MNLSDTVILKSVQVPHPIPGVMAAIDEQGGLLIDMRLTASAPPQLIDRLNADKIELYMGLHCNLVPVDWVRTLFQKDSFQSRTLEAIEQFVHGCFRRLQTEALPYTPVTEVSLYGTF
ncbi:MAG: hypothetical protein COB82_03000 [Marinobacter sp.]|jgi:hypothetical protein|nr:MAG: hypothetical protein COB82_03000 [Marinobacter sp.]